MPPPSPRPRPHRPTAQATGPQRPAPRKAATAADRPRRPAADPRPQLDHPPKAPRKRPRSTRPEALFMHPSPATTGTRRHHQPHKNARSASSVIPRQIHRAHSAPVTAPFLRLLRYSPSPSVKPVSTVFPSSRYRFAISSALISWSPLF